MSGASVIEAILLRWGETHSTGRTVTFLLPDDGGEHPFKALKCGPDNGQRVALSVALILDNETQTPAPKPAKERKRWDELNRTEQAGIRCNDSDFQKFLCERFDLTSCNVIGAADMVRQHCRVESRKQLDFDPNAAVDWDALDADYRFWLQHRDTAHA